MQDREDVVDAYQGKGSERLLQFLDKYGTWLLILVGAAIIFGAPIH